MTLNMISNQADPGGRYITRVFRLLFVSTDNYTTGGVTLDFTSAVDKTYSPRSKVPAYVTNPTNPPSAGDMAIKQVPAGYTAEIIRAVANPTLKNYLFKIWDIDAAGQLAAAGIPAAIYNDVNGFTFAVTTPKKEG